jgi:hypothetical protein
MEKLMLGLHGVAKLLSAASSEIILTFLFVIAAI